MSEELVPWLDPGIAGVDIRLVEFSGKSTVEKAIMIVAASQLSTSAVYALEKVGFQKYKYDAYSWIREGGGFQFREMQVAFPRVREIKELRTRTRVVVDMSPRRQEGTSTVSSMKGAVSLGGFLEGVSVKPRAVAADQAPVSEAPAPQFEKKTVKAPVRPSGLSSLSGFAEVDVRKATQVSPPPVEVAPIEVLPSSSPILEIQDVPVKIGGDDEHWFGERINRYQSRYRPASQVGEPIATIPVNLAAATEAALEQIAEDYGDIDEFVASRLGWTVAQLGEYLSPEQVDAVAMHLAAAARGQGFILADQTGLGKGRVVAAVARAIVLSGKPAIVITEKENLFSDLFRDISDIGSLELFGRPFILNHGAVIVDTNSASMGVIHKPWKKVEVDATIKSGQLPFETWLFLSTYSQYNKVNSPKAIFLKNVVIGAEMILDESHNAVGDSATSENIEAATDLADAVMYSSATFAKHAKSLAAYKRLFPVSMRSSDLMSVLSSGGQAMAEAMAQMLAEDGAYLRREHDLSGTSLEVVVDSERIERNRAFCNVLHPILAEVSKLSRAVSEIADERNGVMPGGADDQTFRGKKASKELWYAGNFGSRLGVIGRQFITALLVDFAVDRAVSALKRDMKPVLVLEQTMESLMRELAQDDGKEVELDENGQEVTDTPTVEDEASAVEDASAPDFKDALRLLLDRTMTLSVRRVGQEDPERIPVDDPQLNAIADKVRGLINEFPDLSLSPIDDIMDRVEKKSHELVVSGEIKKPWVMGEISARTMRVVNGKYVKMPAVDRNSCVSSFNSGRWDGAIVTLAASTGLSMHASVKFLDQRQRKMVELQIPKNPTQRVQMWGRTDRRGQISKPVLEALSLGLPIQTRDLAIQNRKIADLSANVTASADNAKAMDVPDMLDAVGNAVTKRILEDRPGVADRMGIALKLKDMEKADSELYHVNKFLQRLILLPADEQDALYNEAVNAYEDAIRDMAARGQSPRGARELDGDWSIIDSEIFEAGDSRDGPVFGRPVTVTTIQTFKELAPWSGAQVMSAISAAQTQMLKTKGATPEAPFAPQIASITRMRPQLLQKSMSKHHANIKQALGETKSNAVKATEERLATLIQFLHDVRPGCVLQIAGDDGSEVAAILSIRPPTDVEDAHSAGRWSVWYIVPGDETPREISIASIIRDPSAHVSGNGRSISSGLIAKFDAAPRGVTPIQRKVLDGNLVRAVIAARTAGWGTTATWTDTSGTPHRAVLVPKSAQNSLDTLPGRVTDPALAVELLAAGAQLMTLPDEPKFGATVFVEDGDINVLIPGDKRFSKDFEVPQIQAVTGYFRGDQRGKFAIVPMARAEELCEAFAAAGHAFNFEGAYRYILAEYVQSQSIPMEQQREPVY